MAGYTRRVQRFYFVVLVDGDRVKSRHTTREAAARACGWRAGEQVGEIRTRTAALGRVLPVCEPPVGSRVIIGGRWIVGYRA